MLALPKMVTQGSSTVGHKLIMQLQLYYRCKSKKDKYLPIHQRWCLLLLLADEEVART